MSRNYPSMSYCAFENTSLHLNQVMNMLDEALQENEPLDLNEYEKRAYNRMYEQCRKLMNLLEDHQNLIDDCGEEDDSDEESVD
jgi:hypothetical protein